MAWEETRRVAAAGEQVVRAVAHAEETHSARAKARVDESSPPVHGRKPRVRPRWVAPVALGAIVVLGGGALALQQASSPSKDVAPPAASPSPSPTEAAIDIQDTQPVGRYAVTMVRVVSQPSTQNEFAKRLKLKWRFLPLGCLDGVCEGTVSMGNADNPYSWDGSQLTIEREVHRLGRVLCIDAVTRVREPDSGSVWMKTVFAYSVLPLGEVTEPPAELTGTLVIDYTYRDWRPNCTQHPVDPEHVEYNWTATKAG